MSSLIVIAESPREAEEKLNAAEEDLRRREQKHRARGILATVLGPGRFELTLSENVPYGQTMEAWANFAR